MPLIQVLGLLLYLYSPVQSSLLYLIVQKSPIAGGHSELNTVTGGGDSAPLISRAPSRFCWNKRHLTPLVENDDSFYNVKSSKFWGSSAGKGRGDFTSKRVKNFECVEQNTC